MMYTILPFSNTHTYANTVYTMTQEGPLHSVDKEHVPVDRVRLLW